MYTQAVERLHSECMINLLSIRPGTENT